MSMTNIEKALAQSVEDAPLTGPVTHRLRNFTPPNDRMWNSHINLNGGRTPYTLGDAGEDAADGVLQIDLYGSQETGRMALLSRADALLNWYKAGTRLVYDGQEVHVRSASVSRVRRADVGGALVCSVSVFWLAYIPR